MSFTEDLSNIECSYCENEFENEREGENILCKIICRSCNNFNIKNYINTGACDCMLKDKICNLKNSFEFYKGKFTKDDILDFIILYFINVKIPNENILNEVKNNKNLPIHLL